jgi:ubiquinone biosynthesis accessory factor UbiK
MIDFRVVEDLSQRVEALIPGSLKDLREDLSKNLKPALQAGLSKLDLVTREEFEVQRALLERAQARLKALEARLKVLES